MKQIATYTTKNLLTVKQSLIFAFAFFLFIVSSVMPVFSASQIDIVGPAGSGTFGENVTVLPNGNIVVVDSQFDEAATFLFDTGAVYLYDGATLALISRLTGNQTGDRVGSGGITVLTNGNFVVRSPAFRVGSLSAVGAVTWCNATLGCNGTVSVGNSLVGSRSDDSNNSRVTALANGNYVVNNPFWNNPATGISDVGAVTWGNGANGTVGVVSASNSLIGGSNSDAVGLDEVTALTNGNYVVASRFWRNPSPVITNVGAVTWGNGAGGTVGLVTSANSLIGSTDNDRVGGDFGRKLVVALTNGNYVVVSPFWDNPVPVILNVGAVTWGNGSGGTVGVITAANSLVGGRQDDQIGAAQIANVNGAIALTNGNYVVGSPGWDNPATLMENHGAATWGNGSGGTVGLVSASNSLIGGSASDGVGSSVTALTNGNYVTATPRWDNPSPVIMNVGAATWGNGSVGTVGIVTASNSLVGGTTDDFVGNDSFGEAITPLTNGNYVVKSMFWRNPATSSNGAGAATWCSGTGGTVGLVTSGNSLVGSTPFNSVGGSVFALTNGNYVVGSDSPFIQGAGAVTWGNGTGGTAGSITPSNSLLGSTAGDIQGITVLTNGNYVVTSPSWDNTTTMMANVGAVTLGNGAGGTVGFISPTNSAVGGTANDRLGALTTSTTDPVGTVALPNGNYAFTSRLWQNPLNLLSKGAITYGKGNGGTTGLINSSNSLLDLGNNTVFSFDAVRNRFVVGRPSANKVTIASFNRARSDFDGDGKTDQSVFRPSEGNWYLNRSTAGFAGIKWGIASDVITPADYDGDAKADVAVFRASAVIGATDFFILNSATNTVRGAELGLPEDIPTIADYDADGKDDVAIYRPSTNDYYAIQSTNGVTRHFRWGVAGDLPVPGDYDGDGKAEFAVFRPSNGFWYYQSSSNAAFVAVQFGTAGDMPVFADYDGDSKDDIAVYRPGNGFWYIAKSTGGTSYVQWGTAGDIPVPGDYDGDGRYDQAVYRGGTWHINRSTSGFLTQSFGAATDQPTPRYYLP